MTGSVISAIIGHLTQSQWGNGSSGVGNLFSQGNNYSDNDIIGVIQYAISNLMGQRERGQLNQDHSLIQYVQQKTDIQDPEQAREYTYHSIDLMNENGNNNPKRLQSLFDNLLGL